MLLLDLLPLRRTACIITSTKITDILVMPFRASLQAFIIEKQQSSVFLS
jgi:hypothetical protein